MNVTDALSWSDGPLYVHNMGEAVEALAAEVRRLQQFELKPCPFCGGEAKSFDKLDSAWNVWCPECLHQCNWRTDRETAIAAWNRRDGA